ncbi:nucleotidyltransferase family protein [Vineibacter terrae]|uniref:Nucleotidyltransferase family protein n=1 Tax=Vineibacter terrae TaxID=2586908 RepID=A0A5C8PRM2_9HYPH|nr:nucleotidyltransferase family protein [Vineibacter terrae]TXL78749.1 nucleotidyltransferase family protein [Vineibacter terrae]
MTEAVSGRQQAHEPATLTNGRPRRHVRPSVLLERYRNEIRSIVTRHRGANPRVFGSVLRGTDTEDSDLDLLVDPGPGQRMTLFDLSAMFCEIEDLLQIPIDVQTTGGMPTRICEQIEREAQPV